MTLRLLQWRERADRYVARVWLDTLKVDALGQPLEAWVETFEYDKTRPAGMTKAQHLQALKDQTRTASQARLAALQAADIAANGAVLAGEGLDL